MESEKDGNKSALQHNIESKGNNAYYFAHAFKANGPVWDGKPEPRLLSVQSESSVSLDASSNTTDFDPRHRHHHTVSGVRSSFDYSKSTITKYGFLDEGSKVRIYIDMIGIGESHTDEQVHLDYTESSFSLRIVNNNNARDDCLSFGKLYGLIEKATVKLKKDRIVITLFKKKKMDEQSAEIDEVQDDGDGNKETNGEEVDTGKPIFEEWTTIGAQANSSEYSYD